MTQTTSLSFFRYDRASDRAWAFVMMGITRYLLPRVPDIGFWKLCGSGKDEGFTPVLFPRVFAILAVWPDEDTARTRTAEHPVFRRYTRRANEAMTVFLHTTSARGEWSGAQPFSAVSEPDHGPLAALTRATVRPKVAPQFWGRVPRISDVIGNDPHVMFKIGIGEVPLLQQVTFSIWPGAAEMAAFARQSGPHAEAIRAVRENGWFREELYARFAVVGHAGTWEGRNPMEPRR
ncbi:MAG: spheroidene monooxygenase [Pseudomonadota bacterium]